VRKDGIFFEMIFTIVGCIVGTVLTTATLFFCVLHVCECKRKAKVTNLSAVVIENRRGLWSDQADHSTSRWDIPPARQLRSTFTTFAPPRVSTTSIVNSSSSDETRSINTPSPPPPLPGSPPPYNEIVETHDNGLLSRARQHIETGERL